MISASTNKEHYPLPCRLKAVFRYRVFFHIYTAIHITARCFQHIHGFLLSPVYKSYNFVFHHLDLSKVPLFPDRPSSDQAMASSHQY